MKNIVIAILSILLVFVGMAPFLVSANSSIQNNRIEGIRIDQNLKNDPDVNLINLDSLTSRLYTIIDNDKNYYFCLDESKYYPKREIDYELDPDYVYTGDIIWLINNFYEQQELSNSPIEEFKNANFKTQYAATQLAIWSITNSKTYAEDPPKSVLQDNPLIVKLMEEAAKHAKDKNPTFEEILEQLEQTYIHVSDLVPKGEVGDAYAFESTITDNLTNDFTISNQQVKLEITLNTGGKFDITGDSKINLDTEARKIHVEIPKTIINENKDKGELLLTASATIESKNKYYLRYTPVGTSLYQPLATRNILQKNVVDFGTIDVAGVTSISVYKEWDDSQNQDGIRPASIEVQLLANGKAYESKKELNKSNDWAYSWNNLPQTDDDNEPIKYTVNEITKIPGYDSTVTNVNDNLYKITNKYTPKLINISGKKTWNDNNNQDGIRPASIEVQLYANGVYLTSKNTTENNNWAYEFTNLPQFDNGKEIEYTIAEADVPNYESKVDGYNLTNNYTPGKTSITVTKNWDDANNQDGIRPTNIKVQLYANGEPEGAEVTLNEENKWTKTWTDLDEKAAGKTIVYSVKEVTDLGKYAVTIDDDNKGNIIIVNHYTPETIDIAGEKTWTDNDDQDGIRPETIKINLYADGEKVPNQEKTISEKDNWKYEYKDLPKNSNGGKAIVYTVKEDPIENYTTKYDGYNIENIHKPATVNINGEKTWDDKDNQDGKRPAKIIVNLLADGKQIDERIVTEKENWAYEFNDLPKYKKGDEIEYKVAEELIPEYSTTHNKPTEHDITNSYKPGVTARTVMKFWEDIDDQDAKRPEEIKVQLYANGDEQGAPITLNEKNDWTYTWEDLDEMKAGKTIVYTAKEIGVPEEYTVTIDDETTPGTFAIVNFYKPEEVEVKGKKVWDDADNQDGKRPEKIIVNLLADGEQVDERIVTEKEDWAYEFTNLPKYKKGIEIEYRVAEELITDYSTVYDKPTEHDITNSYTPGVTARTVMKFWEDEDNQDGKRPDEITVQLYANGEKLRDPIVLNEDNGWLNSWEDLDEMKDGKKIDYTAKEIGVPDGYKVTIDDETTPGAFVLINEYTPELINVKGKKTWDDKNNQDGKRPSEITVNLLANGEEIDSKKVTEKEKWAYEFTKLPKYENGEEIIYTVTENQVNNYSTEISDANITNSYTPGKTSATVTKRWKDDNDKNGKRPTSISVQLYGDGKAVGSKEKLNKANKWTKTWSNLDEMKDGKKIVYTVKETTTIKDYEVSVDSSNIGNMIVTNKYVGIDACEPKEDDSEKGNSDTNNSTGDDSTADDCEDLATTEPTTNDTDSKIAITDPTTNFTTPKATTPTNTGSLPKTGSSHTLWYVFAGAIIIIVGLIILGKRRSKY